MVKLSLLAAASSLLYVALAAASESPLASRLLPSTPGSPFEATLEFWAIWVILFILYLGGARLVRDRDGSGVLIFVLASSALFRGLLFLGNGFDQSGAFSLAPTPLGAVFPADDALRRIVVTIADLGALAIAPGLLRAAKLPASLVLLHGWNPLVIKETAGSGRVELAALFLLMAALRVLPRARGASAGLLAASLTGPPFLLAAPLALARRLGPWMLAVGAAGAAAWRLAFGGEAVAAAIELPDDPIGGSIWSTLTVLFRLLLTREPIWPLVVGLAAWGALALARGLRTSEDDGPAPRNVLLLLGGLLFVSPHVVPAAFVVFAYLGAHSRNPGWIAFTATAPASYLAESFGGWNFWLGFAQYFAPYALLVFSWLGRPPPQRTAG